MDDSNNNNNATVIRPRPVKPTDSASATVIKQSGPSLDTGQARALTQIGKALKSSDNSTGFEKARQAANAALANNKIILNNRFVLDSILGGGGMGTVYKARDLRKVEADDVNPYVAVKVLNQEFQNHPDAFVTLQREASRSQILAHPNIVLVHDFDRDGSVIYMTMQLLEGQDLDAYIESHLNRGLPTDEALRIIKEYCAALVYAHNKNVVHSDLKPGNIFLTNEAVKVLDFGIARLSAGNQLKDSFDAGKLGALTPAYASLEMFNGEAPDQRDDIYAAAVIAYELFSGKHPFMRKTAQEAIQQNLKPERVSKLTARQWSALESALKLKRSERTPTVANFISQLTYTRKYVWLKIAAAGLLITSAVLGYLEFYAPDELSTVIASTLQKGQQCYDSKDYVCGKESANAVLKMAPGNQQAQTLLQVSTTALQQSQETATYDAGLTCVADGNLDCARAKLSALTQLAPASALLAKLDARIQFKIAQDAATSCFAEKRYDCVVENTATMLRIEPDNQKASSLASQASELQMQSQQKAANNQKNYSESFANAQKCFANSDYDCSKKFAKQALLAKPADISAEMLFQKATYAQVQQQEALGKARNVYDQGLTCFKQKNYSCAIAKSESALEFVPDYKDALRLKQDAQLEITKLKQSIKIE